jgi:hypothetical protein
MRSDDAECERGDRSSPHMYSRNSRQAHAADPIQPVFQDFLEHPLDHKLHEMDAGYVAEAHSLLSVPEVRTDTLRRSGDGGVELSATHVSWAGGSGGGRSKPHPSSTQDGSGVGCYASRPSTSCCCDSLYRVKYGRCGVHSAIDAIFQNVSPSHALGGCVGECNAQNPSDFEHRGPEVRGPGLCRKGSMSTSPACGDGPTPGPNALRPQVRAVLGGASAQVDTVL